MKEKHGGLVPSFWTARRNSLLKAAPMMMGLLLIGNPASAFAEVSSNSVQAVAQQTVTVKGKVIDSKGEALIGVNLIEVGTTNGTITDIDGNFTLNVSANATLKVSYTGYKEVNVSVAGKTQLTITMKEDTQALDEVVVIGYGAVRKADLAGSVAVLDNKSFKDQPIRRTSDALQGRVAGVQVQSNGLPGGQVSIRVRGSNSVNKSNEPLYVIDGMIRESGLDGISPEDIQSMQVLKDASSTAIYGARGSNGVILITTKSGKKGQTQITLDASLSVTGAAKKVDIMGTKDYANALVELGKATTEAMSDYLNGTNPGINWQDEILQNAITQDYKLAFSGGNDKSQFYFSLNYMDQEGLVVNTDHTRYQGKMNVTSQLTKWLHLTADVNLSHNVSHGATLNQSADNIIYVANNYSPTMSIMDDKGNYMKDPYNSIQANPIGQQLGAKRESVSNMVNGHFDLRFNICKGLTFTTTNGFDYFDGKNYNFTPLNVYQTNSSMGNSNNSRLSLQTTNNFTYVGDWNNHHLTATAVWEAASSESRGMDITGKNLLTESVEWYNIGVAANRDATNSYSDWALMSAVGRVMYNFGDRYLLTGTLRADGSSRFMNDKWGVFPSIAAAWTISNEKFMKNATKINDLKLRASYGVVGNQAIDPYSTLGLMNQDNYNFGSTNNFTGYWSNNITAPDLTWEKTNQFDLGIDLSVFNRRLNIGVDYFYKRTTDALLTKSLPAYKGGGSYWVNDGEIMNTGVDFSITGHIFQGEGFNWTTSFNGTYLKNEVKKLAGGPKEIIYGTSPAPGMVDKVTAIMEGQPIGTFYGYVWDGLDENGVDKYVDYNNNGKRDADDKRVLGHATPDFTLGWNNTMSYKNWDFNVFFTGAFGAQRLNMAHYAMSTMNGNSKFITNPDAYFEGFDRIGAGAFYATLKGGANHVGESSKWLENADYFRMDNISVSYTFPKKMTKFADIRLTVSAQNLFTISGYKGMDPAGTNFSTGNVDNNAGIDMGSYPCPRTFTFGARFNF